MAFAMLKSIGFVLELYVYSSDKNYLLFQKILDYLPPTERSLDGGRYIKFTRFKKHPNIVSIPYDTRHESSKIIEKIDWISENTNKLWSMTIIPENSEDDDIDPTTYAVYYQLAFQFSFEDRIDAGFFALRWR